MTLGRLDVTWLESGENYVDAVRRICWSTVLVAVRDRIPQIVPEEDRVSTFHSIKSMENLQKSKQYVLFNFPEDTHAAYKDLGRKVFKQLYEINFQKQLLTSLTDFQPRGFTK